MESALTPAPCVLHVGWCRTCYLEGNKFGGLEKRRGGDNPAVGQWGYNFLTWVMFVEPIGM